MTDLNGLKVSISALLIGAYALVGAACGSSAAVSSVGHSPSASQSVAQAPSPTLPAACAVNTTPSGCHYRDATTDEQSAMVAVAVPAFEADWGYKDVSACGSGDTCFQIGDPPRAQIGVDAGSIYGTEHLNGYGGGSGCSLFLFRDAGGWHYVNGRCAQATGYIPGPQDLVYVQGCANLRDGPGVSSKVIACIRNGTTVDVDSAPVYLDGHIWWHLAGKGWMAHDFLVAPKSVR